METTQREILDFIRSTVGGDYRQPEVEIKPLRGGLVSAEVLWVNLRYRGSRGEKRILRFVVKTLSGNAAREAEIYKNFVPQTVPDLAPDLLGVENLPNGCRLYLEAIRPIGTWPWRDLDHAKSVMKDLARLHRVEAGTASFDRWNYDDELAASGASLLSLFGEEMAKELPLSIRRSVPALRRILGNFPRIRRQLDEFGACRRSLIHGDVHPGNVKIRRRSGKPCAVFIDWGRLRSGSPLEDVSSWLQSLGYWEPHAKRRHDTLLAAYLAAYGQPASLTRDLRDAYWLAAALNQIAGAALYHLECVGAASDDVTKAAALQAASDCFRVIRRADACWKN